MTLGVYNAKQTISFKKLKITQLISKHETHKNTKEKSSKKKIKSYRFGFKLINKL